MAQLDSKKLEKLLSSATNERQRKMYEALLKKARKQEQEAAKASSATETKVKAQAVLGKVQKQQKSSSATNKKKTNQKISEKAPLQEPVLAESPQSEVDNETKSLPKLEAPPKLEKPPAREEKTTKSSSKADSKVVTETLENTSNLTAENNKKLTEEKSSKNQKQAQDKKAKSSKQKETKKENKKTKVQEEKVIFQAFGKMILTPYLKEKDLKIEIEGQEYDLLYGSDYTARIHRALKQELKNKGSRKMLLSLYPNAQFSEESETAKLFFILAGFEKKSPTNQTYPEQFNLRGIWQYISESPIPVISIYRNMEQLVKLKRLNEKQQLKSVQPHHLPIVWENAPVKPFKYAEEVAKDEQMPGYFVEVSAIIKDGIYVVQEMLKEPRLDIPPYIKAEKLKEYDLENIEAHIKKLDKSKTSKGKFQFVLRGKVLIENESEFFELENGTKFSVKEIIPVSYPQEITDWQTIPVINNDAQIVSLILEKPLSSTELMTTPSNLIIEGATIIEVGKIDDRFKAKVYRHKGKTVKITAHSGEVKMKVGQLW